jgi:hypothetical protein
MPEQFVSIGSGLGLRGPPVEVVAKACPPLPRCGPAAAALLATWLIFGISIEADIGMETASHETLHGGSNNSLLGKCSTFMRFQLYHCGIT